MATKKEKEEAQGKPERLVYVGVPDVVSDDRLETLKTDPRWPSIEAIAMERNAEWKKAGGQKADDAAFVAQAEADAAATAPVEVAPDTQESEVSNG